MNIVSVSEARNNFHSVIDKVASGDVVILQKHGKPLVIMVPCVSQEDLYDIAITKKVKSNDGFVLWEDVREDL